MKYLFAILCLVVISSSVAAKDFGCGIDTIPGDQIQFGCGCGYHLKHEQGIDTLFQAEIVTRDRPRMFVDGQLVGLSASPDNNKETELKLGDEFVESYSYGAMTIEFHNVVSFTCSENSQGCEVTRFDTTMVVNSGSCSARVEGLFGDCGC